MSGQNTRLLLLKYLSSVLPPASVPQGLSFIHTVGKSAPFRAGSCCNPYPSHYRRAFASSHPHTRTAIGWPYDRPTFRMEGTIRAYHVPHDEQDGLGALCPPVVWCVHAWKKQNSRSHYGAILAQAYQQSLACFHLRRLSRVHLHSPYCPP